MLSLKASSGRKWPARSALSLVFNSSDVTFGSPVHLWREPTQVDFDVFRSRVCRQLSFQSQPGGSEFFTRQVGEFVDRQEESWQSQIIFEIVRFHLRNKILESFKGFDYHFVSFFDLLFRRCLSRFWIGCSLRTQFRIASRIWPSMPSTCLPRGHPAHFGGWRRAPGAQPATKPEPTSSEHKTRRCYFASAIFSTQLTLTVKQVRMIFKCFCQLLALHYLPKFSTQSLLYPPPQYQILYIFTI